MITHDMTEAMLLADRDRGHARRQVAGAGHAGRTFESDDAYVGELLGTPRRQAERLGALLPRDGAA